MDLDLVAVITKTGELPHLLSKYKPSVPILACSESDLILRQLTTSRGIICHKLDELKEESRPSSSSSKSIRKEMAKKAISAAKNLGLVKPGGKVLFMQEHGTDFVPNESDVLTGRKGHSYKKIVEVQ